MSRQSKVQVPIFPPQAGGNSDLRTMATLRKHSDIFRGVLGITSFVNIGQTNTARISIREIHMLLPAAHETVQHLEVFPLAVVDTVRGAIVLR